GGHCCRRAAAPLRAYGGRLFSGSGAALKTVAANRRRRSWHGRGLRQDGVRGRLWDRLLGCLVCGDRHHTRGAMNGGERRCTRFWARLLGGLKCKRCQRCGGRSHLGGIGFGYRWLHCSRLSCNGLVVGGGYHQLSAILASLTAAAPTAAPTLAGSLGAL